MINKLKFFSFEDRKIFYLAMGVVFAVFVFIYYFFNYGYLTKKIDENRNLISSLNADTHINVLKRENEYLKNRLDRLKKQKASLEEDLRYLELLLKTTKSVNVSKPVFLSILSGILKSASKNSIIASYTITEKKGMFDKKIITIKGNFPKGKYKNFYNFVKSIESVKILEYTKSLDMKEENSRIDFTLVCEFWSLK